MRPFNDDDPMKPFWYVLWSFRAHFSYFVAVCFAAFFLFILLVNIVTKHIFDIEAASFFWVMLAVALILRWKLKNFMTKEDDGDM